MSDPNNDTGTLPTKPVFLTGQQIYDTIMGDIEPDLVTAAIAGLDEKYKAETPEQHASRMDRYKTAEAEYDRRYATYITNLTQEVNAYRKQAVKAYEQRSRQREDTVLANLESSMSSL